MTCPLVLVKSEENMSAWIGNWRERIKARLSAHGYENMTNFLIDRPAVSYIEIADLLGKEDVAAFQVEWLHYEEAVTARTLRQAAMDSIVRDIAHNLPCGWKDDPRGDFHTAG